MTRRALAWVALLALGCPRDTAPLRLAIQPMSFSRVRLTLSPGPGFRLNARLVPVLERAGLGPQHFDPGPLSPDSAYFSAPTSLTIRGPASGVIRASVCRTDTPVCQLVELPVAR